MNRYAKAPDGPLSPFAYTVDGEPHLVGAVAICDYLDGCSRHCLARWRREGLPVRMSPFGIVAKPQALDAWFEQRKLAQFHAEAGEAP